MKRKKFAPVALAALPALLWMGGIASADGEKDKNDPKPATEVTPDPGYKVINESQPGFPKEVSDALAKAKVPPPPKDLVIPKHARLEIDSSKGKITVELDANAAPLHAKSFYYLSKRGFFDGITFHRYEPGFVIQGGDPLSKNPKLGSPYAEMTGSPSGFHGVGGPGYQVPREYNNLKHEKFVLSMARSSNPNSAGSQFFITLAKTEFLDKENSHDGVGYTVFGKVVSGQDVVMAIRAGDKINKVTVVEDKKPE